MTKILKFLGIQPKIRINKRNNFPVFGILKVTKLNSDVYKLEKDAGTLYSDPKQRPIMD